MGRRIKLNDEQVQFLRTHRGERTMKDWGLYFDCSELTIFNAIHKKGVYDFELAENSQ